MAMREVLRRSPQLTLLLIFSLLAAALAGVGYAFLAIHEDSLRAQAARELESVATLDARFISSWRGEREADASLLQQDEILRRALAGAASPGLAPLLEALRRHGYASAALLDAAGATLEESGAPVGRDARARRLVSDALATGRATWEDFHSDGAGAMHLELAVPVARDGRGARPLGVVLLRVDPGATLFPLLESWPAPRHSAESLLVRRDGDEVVVLSALRTGARGGLGGRWPLTERGLPAVQAVRGAREGFGVDYRGVRVLFAARSVEGSPWLVVSKIDEAEVLGPGRARGDLAAALGLLLLLVAALGAELWLRSREGRIERGRQAAERERDALRRRFEGLAEFAHDVVLLLAEDGSIVEANHRAVECYGYSLAELRQLDVRDLRAPETVGSVASQMEEATRRGGLRFETRHRRRDGSTFPVEVSSAVLEVGGARFWQSIVRDITGRKRAEEALREREENLATTLHSIGDGVIVTDAAGRITRMNPVAEQLTGWPGSEALGRSVEEVFRIVHEATREPVESPVARVLREGVVVGLANHTLLVSRSGSPVPIADSGAPIRKEDGTSLGVVLVFRNATEQRRADAAAAYQATLLATLSEAVVGLDTSGRIVSWHGAAERIYGWRADEVLGRDVEDLLRPEYPDGEDSRQLALLGAAGSAPARVWQRRKDGTRVAIEAAGGVLRGPSGELAGYVTANRDVSDRVRAEEAARLSEEKFRTAFHRAGFGALLSDREGRILDHNQALRDLLGYTAEELAAMRVMDLNAPELAGRSRAFLAGLFAGEGATHTDERHYRRKDGAILEVLIRVSSIRGPSGALEYTLGIVEDVTERRRLERQLLASDRMASMGMLAASVTHEINNPLSFVLANLRFAREAMARGGEPVEEIAGSLDEALDGVERVRGIVRDVKTFAHEREDEERSSSLAQVIRSVSNLAANEIRHRARLVLDLGEVPRVAGSARRLGQVFLNLLLNAAQAIPPGKAAENEIRVRAFVERPGTVAVEVRDTGSGIAPEIRGRLFQPFATTKPPGQGTGLGLFVSRGIVAALGGEIEVDGEPGRGSLFRVRLPAGEESPRPTPATTPSPDPASRPARILIVDDEPLVGRVLARIVSPPHRVVVETSARAALERLASDAAFDVVFCDLMMPDLTGMEFHARLGERDPRLAARVAFLTGGAFTAEARRFLESVPNHRFEKPFEPDDIRAHVMRALQAEQKP